MRAIKKKKGIILTLVLILMLLVTGSDVALGEEEKTTFSVDEMINKDLTPKTQGPSTRKIQLEADSRSYIEAPFGSNEVQLKRSIISGVTVYAGGEMINRNDIDIVDIETESDFDTLEKTTVSYTVVHKDQSQYESTRVTDHSMHVEYYKGTAVIGQDRFKRHIAGFNTLPLNDNRDQVQLVASSVLGRDNDAISTGDGLYYKVDLFQPPTGQEDVSIENDMSGDKGYSANANEGKQDALKKWDNNTTVNTGDVLRTWSANSEEDGYYYGWSEVSNNLAQESGYMYYYVHGGYLNSFKFNSLKPRERIIAQNASDEYLKATILSSFENGIELKENFSDVTFKKLPDREKEGETTAEITIKERYHYMDKTYEHTIEVPFSVVEPSIEIDEEDMHFPVGTDVELSNPSEFIKTIYQFGEEADITDFDVNIYPMSWSDYDNETVGHTQKMILEINSKRWSRDIVFGDIIDFDFIWGNTLANKGVGSNDYDASVSLLKNKDNKPYLSANNGEGLTYNTSTNPKVAVYSESDTKDPKIKEETNNGKRAEDVKNDFQRAFSNHGEFEYGDVLVYGVSNETEVLSAKDDELVNEAKEFKEAYYELTSDGYHLLRLNQLKVKDDMIELGVGDDMNHVTEKLKASLIVPSDLENNRKIRYEADESTIDVSKPSTNKKGTINVYEKLATDEKEFMTTYEIPYSVEQSIGLELQPINVPVGTDIGKVNPNDYITKVTVGDKVLNQSEYTASFEKAPNTNKVGIHETIIKIVTKNDNRIVEKTATNIIWGSSIVTKTNDNKIDASISLLHENNKPYLMANEGTGFGIGNLDSRPFFYVYQDSLSNEIGGSGYHSVGSPAKNTMDKWNSSLADKQFKYGHVLGYKVDKKLSVDTNEMGEKTWVSRDEELVKETVGYDMAYYEMTKDGYKLMRFNQVVANEKILTVPFNIKFDEMNKKAAETVVLPKDANPEDFRFEFANVDTSSSGKKKTKLNIYEKLVSGGEFMSTMDVEYIVNVQVTEKYYDEAGKEIKIAQRTNFDFGKTYQPKPDNFISSSDALYSYKGWLKENEKPGIDTPRTGIPEETAKEATFHYIYEKSEKQINMTIPTEMIFGTENGKDVTSVDYEIKNNSSKVKTAVSLNEFKKETSEVKLLTSKEKDPTKTTQSARLNLTTNGQTTVGSLNDTTKNETITTLSPGEKASMGISGNYFGSQKESARIRYNMMLKFTVVPD